MEILKNMIKKIVWVIIGALLGVATWNFLGWASEDKRGTIDYLELMSQIFELVQVSYLEETNPVILAEGAVDGMLLNSSQYNYLIPAEGVSSLIQKAGAVDAGIVFGFRDAFMYVIDVAPGSGAGNLGIETGDIILRIKDQVSPGLTYLRSQRLLTGESGETIELIIKRSGMSSFDEVKMEFTNFQTDNSQKVESQNGILYVQPPRELTSTNLSELLKELPTAVLNAKEGVILDLRHVNRGDDKLGLQLADWFTPDGVEIGGWRSKSKESPDPIVASDGVSSFLTPLVAIIDSTTSGPGDACAAALKSAERAKIVGEKSFGKCIKYRNVALNPQYSMMMVEAELCDREGTPVHDHGVVPDRTVMGPPQNQGDEFLNAAKTALESLQTSNS